MSKRNCITKRRLGDLALRVFGERPSEYHRIMRTYTSRKRLWAAFHNYLNKGHPKGPRKPHKWTNGKANPFCR